MAVLSQVIAISSTLTLQMDAQTSNGQRLIYFPPLWDFCTVPDWRIMKHNLLLLSAARALQQQLAAFGACVLLATINTPAIQPIVLSMTWTHPHIPPQSRAVFQAFIFVPGTPCPLNLLVAYEYYMQIHLWSCGFWDLLWWIKCY